MLEGAGIIYGWVIVCIRPTGSEFKVTIFDEQNKMIRYEQVKADSTIICIRQGSKNKQVLTIEGLESSQKGFLITDGNGKITRQYVFAAGDVVSGPRIVVHAVQEARSSKGDMRMLGT
ncbi:MAG: FAD-dependent oxidoreductase [Lachnospiraceae bacterium]|nr:FAD-dependent oxidoreductase [Lachnospiraceae bacterium]